jgi:predicted metal-dependent TIM-barrel fold hydrolase
MKNISNMDGMEAVIDSGLDAMLTTAEVALDVTEACNIIAIAYAQARLVWGDDADEDQIAACISAVRAAYVVGKERRTMFAGYG